MDPSLNSLLRPGDVIDLVLSRPSFTAVGSARENGVHRFSEERMTLAEALGVARGLTNSEGARNGIFVCRLMPKTALARFGAELSQFPDEVVPVVFAFDFTEPQTLFAAQIFEMRDGDVLYVSDSLFEEIGKVLDVVTRIVSPSNVSAVAVELN